MSETLVRLLNDAEVRLATLRNDARPAVPENPGETVGSVVRAAEASLEEAKRLLRAAADSPKSTSNFRPSQA